MIICLKFIWIPLWNLYIKHGQDVTKHSFTVPGNTFLGPLAVKVANFLENILSILKIVIWPWKVAFLWVLVLSLRPFCCKCCGHPIFNASTQPAQKEDNDNPHKTLAEMLGILRHSRAPPEGSYYIHQYCWSSVEMHRNAQIAVNYQNQGSATFVRKDLAE